MEQRAEQAHRANVRKAPSRDEDSPSLLRRRRSKERVPLQIDVTEEQEEEDSPSPTMMRRHRPKERVPLQMQVPEEQDEEMTPMRRTNRNRRRRKVVLPDIFQEDSPEIDDASSVGFCFLKGIRSWS